MIYLDVRQHLLIAGAVANTSYMLKIRNVLVGVTEDKLHVYGKLVLKECKNDIFYVKVKMSFKSIKNITY